MKRTLVLALAAAATLFAATAAQAARVDWSVGINVPPIGAVVQPGYAAYAAPVVYAPRPRFIAPAPVFAPRPIFYGPRPRFWLPPLPPLPFFGHEHWRHDGHVGWRR